MRVILFSQDRVSVEQPEVYAYLLILLVFALAASYYVLTESLKDPDRSRYKIMLRCILIITNVVPPELPMQLSIAVNYSIIQLIQRITKDATHKVIQLKKFISIQIIMKRQFLDFSHSACIAAQTQIQIQSLNSFLVRGHTLIMLARLLYF